MLTEARPSKSSPPSPLVRPLQNVILIEKCHSGNNGQKVLGFFLGREGQKGRRAVGWIPAKNLRE